MSQYDHLAMGSNEGRNQRIMHLRDDFRHKRVITVGAAVKRLGLREATIVQYCMDGDIPLIDADTGQPVVALTDQNRPQWLK